MPLCDLAARKVYAAYSYADGYFVLSFNGKWVDKGLADYSSA